MAKVRALAVNTVASLLPPLGPGVPPAVCHLVRPVLSLAIPAVSKTLVRPLPLKDGLCCQCGEIEPQSQGQVKRGLSVLPGEQHCNWFMCHKEAGGSCRFSTEHPCV